RAAREGLVSARLRPDDWRASAAALLLVLSWSCPAAAARAGAQVEARLSQSSIDAGAVTSLLVIVTDPTGAVNDPQFAVPAGLDLLGSSRGQQFSVINGRSTNQVTFRYEIASTRPGRFVIGPFKVPMGSQVLRAEEATLVVTAQAPVNAVVPRPAPGRS